MMTGGTSPILGNHILAIINHILNHILPIIKPNHGFKPYINHMVKLGEMFEVDGMSLPVFVLVVRMGEL